MNKSPSARAGAFGAAFAVAAASAFISTFPLSGCETFYHLAIGREAALSGRIVSEGFFSVSGQASNTSGWLGSLALYKVYTLFGIAGIVVFRAAIGAITGLLMYLAASGRLLSGGAALGAMTLGLYAGWGSDGPGLFSYPLIALLQYLLIRYQDGRFRLFYIIPLLMLALDLLGGAFWGAAYLCVSICSFAMSIPSQRSMREEALKRLKMLGILSIASAGLIALHPYGLRTGLVEWTQSPLEAARESYVYMVLAAMSCLSVLYLGFKGQNLRGLRVLGAVLFLVFAPFVEGGVALVAIASVPLMADAASFAASQVTSRPIRLMGWLALVVAIVALGYVKLSPSSKLRIGVGADAPLSSMRFIHGSGLGGNLAHPPEYGGCVAFYLYPGMRVTGPESYKTDGIMLAILRRAQDAGERPAPGKLAPEDWALVYWDGTSEVYLRRVPENRESIARMEIELLLPGTGPARIIETANKSPHLAPRLALEAARLLEYSDNDALADALARILLMQGIAPDEGMRLSAMALNSNPENIMLKAAWGLHLYQSGGSRESAERAMREGLKAEPRQQALALGLAYLHYDSGRYAEAYSEFDRMVGEDGSRRALYGRSLALMKLGRQQEARRDMDMYLRGE